MRAVETKLKKADQVDNVKENTTRLRTGDLLSATYGGCVEELRTPTLLSATVKRGTGVR